MPDAMLLAMPGFDWGASFIYDGYTKFGMWDEMLKEPAPNPQLPGATISYLQSRATALAATGKLDEARAELAKTGEADRCSRPPRRRRETMPPSRCTRSAS